VTVKRPWRANLGCGGQIVEGWVNIDRDFGSLMMDRARAEWLKHDLREPLPFDDGQLAFAVMHHVLDLFEPDDAYEVLVECRRVIRPGGTLRVSLADVERAIEAAETIDDAWFAPLGRQFASVQHALDNYLRLDGQRKMFLTRTLTAHLLQSAGFTPFVVAYRHTTADDDERILDLDTRPEESIWLEGRA
jgi:predicted SAM-dependent methyltransferase